VADCGPVRGGAETATISDAEFQKFRSDAAEFRAEVEVGRGEFGRIGAIFGVSALVAALVFGGSARAQGSGHEHHGNPNNSCPLMVGGMHEMHVAAYHSSTGLFDELCVDIPGTGKVSITLDAVGSEIRDMTTEIRVVKGEGTEAAPMTVAHIPPTRYPSGVATFTVDFDAPGKYALIVTLREGAMEMSSTHVLNVAHPLQKWAFVPVGAALVMVGAGIFYFWSERRKKLQPKTG
jgi:hypothetical protein